MSYGLVIAGQSHGVTANVNNCLCIFVMIVIKETGKILINIAPAQYVPTLPRACIPNATSAIPS